MARRSSDDGSGIDPTAWMLTFSDMVTLLLTFFVMIISITALEPGSLAEIDDPEQASNSSISLQGPGHLGFSNPLLVSYVTAVAENVDDLPPDVSLDQDEILAAMFQLDPINTPDYQRLEREVSDSVSIVKDERGMVIRWDKSVLFPEGGAVLREENAVLLLRLAELLNTLTLPVSVDCHTNPFSDLEGGDSSAAYTLSTRRSKVVMEHLVSAGLPESRLRLGSFGGSRPVAKDPAQGALNSRLEIVIYKPVRSSWKG
ncbi:MAG: OmpA family protein [Deltaproteobacteria bacterium]|jgi:chemotaxis protein MotB|nr:OmpA family protein [Deltaproteobacteria bacterium]